MGGANNKISYDYHKEEEEGLITEHWMSHLPDHICVSEVTYPGTHNTGTWTGHGGPIARCQKWTLSEQLCNGQSH